VATGPVGPAAEGVRVRRIESLAELAAAWRLVAGILHQDDSHPGNYGSYTRHSPRHPELLPALGD
jgi:hypothetical protein